MRYCARHRLHRLAPVVVGLALLSACPQKRPAAPPEFDAAQRSPTGDTAIETRISDGIALEGLTDEELAALGVDALGVGQELALSRYLRALLGRERLPEAMNLLHERASQNLNDDPKLADALELAMGQLQWGACDAMVRSYLERRPAPGLFLIRALCLQRAGDPVAAQENVEAAVTVGGLPADAIALFRPLLDERGTSAPLRPLADEPYFRLVRALADAGPFERLLIAHLAARREPTWTIGSVTWPELNAGEQRTVVQSRARSYRHCQELAGGSKGPGAIAGSVTVGFVVDGFGRVTAALAQEPSWSGHPQGDWLDACLVDQIQRLRFPPPPYGLPIPMQQRFAYSAG